MFGIVPTLEGLHMTGGGGGVTKRARKSKSVRDTGVGWVGGLVGSERAS